MTSANDVVTAYRTFAGWRAQWAKARLFVVAEAHQAKGKQLWFVGDQYAGSTFDDGRIALPVGGGPLFSSPEMASLYFLFNNPSITEQEFLDAIDTVG